jgi:hypothetical protein
MMEALVEAMMEVLADLSAYQRQAMAILVLEELVVNYL